MTAPERIPKAMAEKFAAITALTDAFCAQHLNEEYRRLIHRVGPERVPALIALRMADKAGSGTPYNTADVDRLRSALHMAAKKHQPLTLQELAVDGHDLIALGVPAGPRIGRLLSELLERVLDNPKLNERETLLALVRQSL